MNLNLSRKTSFVVIAIIYALAVAVGITTYSLLNLSVWAKILIADVVATVFVFAFSVILKNASVYDPYWSVQPPVILIAVLIKFGVSLSGLIITVAVVIWAVRLTANWAYTFYGLSYQDWRYTMLKEKTGKFYPFVNFTGIHTVPTLIVYACTLPAVYVIINKPDVNVLAVLSVLISLVAVTLQCVSDVQMHVFRKSKTGGLIRVGLWKYSRHPNYLGEILMWWGVGLFSVAVLPDFWFFIAGAISNTLLFLTVSIPMADKRQSRKDGFEEYKLQTRALLPIYKRQK